MQGGDITCQMMMTSLSWISSSLDCGLKSLCSFEPYTPAHTREVGTSAAAPGSTTRASTAAAIQRSFTVPARGTVTRSTVKEPLYRRSVSESRRVSSGCNGTATLMNESKVTLTWRKAITEGHEWQSSEGHEWQSSEGHEWQSSESTLLHFGQMTVDLKYPSKRSATYESLRSL